MVRVRFAPSPTGYLHIGGVRTALFNWLWARQQRGVFVLRIEDTDQERSTAASEQVILDSLSWLEIDWDEGPGKGGSYGPYKQMERLSIYKEYADKLIAAGNAYRCYCTKEDLDIQRAALKEKDPKAHFRYPRTCRSRKDQPDLPHVVRFRMPDGGGVTYRDKVFGEVVTPNDAQQDFVLLRTDGVPLYNFGAVVDDFTMDITLVARGRDHMVNTPPQILLYEALGARVPDFAHLPMMLAPSGEKLSKRHGAVSALEYRDQGYSPHAVLNYLSRFGWSADGEREVFSISELTEAFSWDRVGRGDGKFDAKKFLAINHEHLKSTALTPDAEYAIRTQPFLAARGLDVGATHATTLTPGVELVRPRARTFVEAADQLDFFFRDPPTFDDKAKAKFLVPEAVPHLRGFADAVKAVTAWEEAPLEEAVTAWLTAAGLAIKDVAQSARVALTGRSASPGLFQVLVLLGRETSLGRLEQGIALASTPA